MYTKQPKKLLIINILDILRRYTDEEHHLSQKQIEDILREEYDMPADRKTIKTNLMNLIDFGYEIEYSEKTRMYKNKNGELEESSILSDFYHVRDSNDSELRLIIDSLLFSTHLPYSQCRELVEKLEKQSSKYFHNRVKHIATMPRDKSDNKTNFYNVDGQICTYVVYPYQMVAKEGNYYLICNYDPFEDISNYRLDRIINIRMRDEKAKPFKQLRGANGLPLNLAAYMKEHIYMYSSDASIVKFKIKKEMIIDMIDKFGKEVKFTKLDDEYVTAMVKANNKAALQFAKNYSPDAIIMEPKELREQAIEELRKGLEGYGY